MNIRTEPHNAGPAGAVVGQAQRFHQHRYDCWAYETAVAWTQDYDYSTGAQGRTRDDLLVDNGAMSCCD